MIVSAPSPAAPTATTTGIDSGIPASNAAGQKRRRQWASARLRLWAAASLALYFVFWLEHDHPHGAGTSAATVYQPSLGASLRKALFRIIGTVVGAVAIVVLTAYFPAKPHRFSHGFCRAYSLAVIQRIATVAERPLRAKGLNHSRGRGLGRAARQHDSAARRPVLR